ncbi:MAG: hypothetical protein FWH17_05205 [Oscillospiraceae bacterium]|nr:hypothetical protein [Oscillospiraceae bacterium]
MKRKITIIFLAMLLLLANTLSFAATAAKGNTGGGGVGSLVVTYNIYFYSNEIWADTTTGSSSPNPNLSTYIEGRYYDPDSQTNRISTASGGGSAVARPPNGLSFTSGKSVHTANSQAWGYFQGTLYAP